MVMLFVDELTVFALGLGRGAAQRFSSLHWMMLSNGDADFHDNVIFFGFDDHQMNPVLVAKVPRLVENGWMLQAEHDHLVELWDCIGAQAGDYIPKPYAMTTLQGRPVLLISYVAGESLTRLSRKSFWGNSEQVSALAMEAARALRGLNQLTERSLDRGEVLDSHFREKIDKFRELFQLTAEENQILSEMAETIEQRLALADHKVLIQGDFWHGNMIQDEKQRSLKFVDWQFAHWSADVSMDVYFFLLAGALSATENLPEDQRAKKAFDFLKDWRDSVIPVYLEAYGQPEHYVLLPEKYGMLACCVEKATRSALEFGYSHPDDLLWRHLFAELLHWPS